MKPPRFTYEAPTTLADALALLDRHGYDAKVLAGGQSLVPLMNFRLARPAVLVDINRVGGLDTIADDEASRELVLGALVRQSDAERSPLVARRSPLLLEAIRHIGHRTIRNRGTIGGSLAHADPSAELPLVLVATDGRVELQNAAGVRTLGAREFFVSFLQTAIAANELLVRARFPWLERERYAFVEFSRRSGDFALAAVCATAQVRDGRVDRARIAVAGGGPVPVRALEAETALAGASLADERVRAEAGSLAAAACDVESDIHASAEYRRELIATLVTRALDQLRKG